MLLPGVYRQMKTPLTAEINIIDRLLLPLLLLLWKTLRLLSFFGWTRLKRPGGADQPAE